MIGCISALYMILLHIHDACVGGVYEGRPFKSTVTNNLGVYFSSLHDCCIYMYYACIHVGGA